MLATMSGSTVICRGGLVGPEEESESGGRWANGTWSKMSAGLCPRTPWSATAPSSTASPTVLVRSGGWTPSRDPADGLQAGGEHAAAPSVAALSR